MEDVPPYPVTPPDLVAQIDERGSLGRHAAGHHVFSQGDPADALFYLREGKVKLAVVSDTGREAIIALLKPGDFLGESALAGQSHRVSTAVCLCPCVISRIETSSATRLIRNDRAFSDAVIRHLLARSIRAEADLIALHVQSSEQRLARLLLALANYGTSSPPEPVITNITQEMLAQMVGTTRARVSYFMNRFRARGHISYNGRIEVHASLQTALPDHAPPAWTGRNSAATITSAQPAGRKVTKPWVE